MSVALLDVNVLIALFDSVHTHHERAHRWFGAHRSLGWATCPITANGLIRILSWPRYSKTALTLVDAADRLSNFCSAADHFFWSDDVSVLDVSLFHRGRIGGHKKLTDAYLLGLAVRHKGRLATFDRGLPLHAVVGAREEHLCLLG